MFRLLLSCSLLLSFCIGAGAPSKPGWVLDVRDEFDGSDVKTNLWRPFYLESRTERARAAARFELTNGHLVLFVDGDSRGYAKDGTNEMTASSLQTGDDTRLHKTNIHHHDIARDIRYAPRFGFFEIRAKLPSNAYAAFWMMGAREKEGQAGEVDVFETIPGKTRLLKFALHTWGDRSLIHRSLRPEPSFDVSTDFHVYGLEWTSNDCVLYYDGARVTNMGMAPTYPAVFLLTLQGNTRSKERKEFVIDWFRAWKREGEALTPGFEKFR